MSSMRSAGAIAILLILLILLAGCGQRVPTRNTTTKNPWTPTPKGGGGGSASQTTAVPTTPSPLVQVTVTPTETVTGSPTSIIPPPPVNLTANLTVVDEITLVLSWNRTAYTYNLENPPLLIEYTLTVPNITKTRVITDPVTGGDKTVTITYPHPDALFEVTVKDLETNRILAREGYGGQYDVSYSKDIWIRYPGTYYIEFFGRLVTAKIKFSAPKEM